MKSRVRKHIRNYGIRITAPLLAIAVALALCEAILQGYYRFQHDHWLWEMRNEYKVPYVFRTEDPREYVLRKGFSDKTLGLTVDSHGFRVTAPPPDLSQPIVVCLGDSVPFGAGVRDQETFAS